MIFGLGVQVYFLKGGLWCPCGKWKRCLWTKEVGRIYSRVLVDVNHRKMHQNDSALDILNGYCVNEGVRPCFGIHYKVIAEPSTESLPDTALTPRRD
jgi:hypothetical protein